MKRIKYYLSFLLFTLSFTFSFSQPIVNTPPEIGKPCPGFILSQLKSPKGGNFSLKDLEGKFAIIDFWGSGCHACINSFPKLNALQKQFNSLQILLVGRDDEYIRPLYKRFQKKFSLELMGTYDSAVFHQMYIAGVPIVYWIDNRGIIKAITADPRDLNKENVSKFMKGEPFPFEDYSIAGQKKRDNFYDFMKPLLINGNGGADTSFLFRSLLMRSQPNTAQYDPPFIGVKTGKEPYGGFALIHKNMVQGTVMSLSKLYEVAYGDTMCHTPVILGYGDVPMPTSYGRFWQTPIIEVADTSPFIIDYSTLKNLYNYSLIVPLSKAKTPYVQKIMQNDLQNYFGYAVSVEERVMPCWNVEIISDQYKKNLLTKKKANKYEYTPSNAEFLNKPFATVIHLLWGNYPDGPPFIDCSGMTENIDLTLNSDFSDFQAFQKELEKHGIRIVKSKKSMKVIVIRDKKS